AHARETAHPGETTHAREAAHAGQSHAGHAGEAAHAREAAHAGHAAAGHHLLHVLGHGHLLHAGDLPHEAEVLAEAAHHLLHEQELLHQLAPRLGLGARALGDALDALGLADERVGVALLEARHRLDDGLDAHELAIVEVHVLREAAGEHAPERELVHEVL